MRGSQDRTSMPPGLRSSSCSARRRSLTFSGLARSCCVWLLLASASPCPHATVVLKQVRCPRLRAESWVARPLNCPAPEKALRSAQARPASTRGGGRGVPTNPGEFAMMGPAPLIASDCLTARKFEEATGKHRTVRARTCATGGRDSDGSTSDRYRRLHLFYGRVVVTAQRDLPQEPGQRKRDQHNRDGGLEHRAQCCDERGDHRLPHRRRQSGNHLG